ncbi:MAG: enoyl-CoA hydratase/isomerase family protein [Rubrivivax sp.]
MSAAWGSVAGEVEGAVMRLSFSRPPYNHVDMDLLRDLADALEAVDTDPSLRAVLLASEGGTFCAGADFISRRPVAPEGQGGMKGFYAQAARLFANRKPVVAAIQGAAIGAGLGLALAADFRVASPAARFSANFVKLGFHAGFGITLTLPRVIGEQRAALMLMTGRRIKAEQALEWGLIDELADAADLPARAMAFAQELAENAPLAVQATRDTLRSALHAQVLAATDRELAIQSRLRKTSDFAEGVRAVAARRPGNFTGT